MWEICTGSCFNLPGPDQANLLPPIVTLPTGFSRAPGLVPFPPPHPARAGWCPSHFQEEGHKHSCDGCMPPASSPEAPGWSGLLSGSGIEAGSSWASGHGVQGVGGAPLPENMEKGGRVAPPKSMSRPLPSLSAHRVAGSDLLMVLICIPLVTSDADYLFRGSWIICVCSWEKCLFKCTTLLAPSC